MKFIEVHTETGNSIFINVNNIDYILFNDTYTHIRFNNGNVLDVSETSEKIKTMLLTLSEI